jgi:peptidoglycan-associated lipoprotein
MMMGRWVGVLLAVVLSIAVVSCSAKKKSGLEEGEGKLGEDTLGTTPGGSLDVARAGGLGAAAAEGPLTDIHFAYDSFDLEPEARQTLKQNAAWLESHPDAHVEIEGHCDDRGTVEYNLALGTKRAAAVKSYLESLGISASRITTVSYGEELPLCHEETESCWSTNRRAHSVVVTG